MTELPDEDLENHPGRADKRSTVERLNLVERDVRSHARSLTAIIETAKSLSPQQVTQIEAVVRDVLAEVGLRLDDPDHVDAIREDQRFLRRFRLWWVGAANKVGNIVLVAIVGVLLTIAGAGFWAWLKSGGGSP
jgi:hypothetical protein